MMSVTSTRPAKAGKEKPGKTAAQNAKPGTDGKASDCPNPKIQPTAEQMRLAQIINDTKDSDDPELKNKIDQIMELTNKTRDEAVIALHDCDSDPNRAIDMLLEGGTYQGAWETSGKKKKNRPVSSAGRPADTNVASVAVNNKENRNRPDRHRDQERDHEGSRNRGPPRMNRGGSSSRGWRTRENEKNERNLEENKTGNRGFEGRGRGRLMNGQGGRGRGRGGPRSRTFQNRGSRGGFPQSIDTWTNSTADQAEPTAVGDNTMNVGNWSDSFPPTEDWDNEDWTGSLSETKVFTPSVSASSPNIPPLQESTNSASSSDLSALSLLQKQGQSTSPISNSLSGSQYLSQYAQQATESLKSAVGIGLTPSASSQASSYQGLPPSAFSSSNNYQSSSNFSSSASFPADSVSTSPVSQLTCLGEASQIQGSQSQQMMSNSISVSALVGVQQSGRMAAGHSAGQQSMPQRIKSQRTRLPPPSKIPSSAVEMPDDAITSLDVQFGGLDFGTEPSTFEFPVSETSSFQPNTGSNQTSMSLASSQQQQNSSSALNKAANNDSSAAPSYASSHSAPASSKSLVAQNSASLAQSNSQGSLSSQKGSSDLVSYSQTDRKAPTSYGTQRSQSGIDASLSAGKSESSTLGSSYGSQSSHVTGYQSSYACQKPSLPYSVHQPNLTTTDSFSHSSLPGHPSGIGNTHSNLPQQQTGLNTSQSQTVYSVSQSQPVVSTSYPSVQSGTGLVSSYQSQSQTNYPVSAVQSTPSYQVQSTPTQSSSSASSASSSFASVSAPVAYQAQPSYGSHQSGSGVSGAGVGPQAGSVAATYSPGQSQSSAYSSHSAAAMVHASPITTSKLSASLSSTVKDGALDSSSQHSYESCHSTSSSSSLTSTLPTTTTASITSGNVTASSTLGLTTSASVATTVSNLSKTSLSTSKTAPQNLPPGVPTMLGHQYIMSQASLPFYGLPQQVYSYEEMQMFQQRLSMAGGYYDMSFQQPPTSITGRDSSGLANVVYSGTDAKFSRGDAASPVPTTLSQQQTTTQHQQQAFLNAPPLPPGYGYYYAGGMMPAGNFTQYGTPIFSMPPVTNATSNSQFQKPTAYPSHAYNSGYDNLNQTQDYKGGYGSGSQNQSKGVGGSLTSTSGGSNSAADISGSVYSKTHSQLGKSFDKPGFHAGTPPPFNMQTAQTGPMGAPSTQYAAAQFIPLMTHHQQHPTQMLHHQLHPDSQGSGSQRSNQTVSQQKSGSGSKQNYTGNYWATN